MKYGEIIEKNLTIAYESGIDTGSTGFNTLGFILEAGSVEAEAASLFNEY